LFRGRAGVDFANEYPLAVRRAEKRSEEHTSELQSRGQLVCRLLLEKKNEGRQLRLRADCDPIPVGLGFSRCYGHEPGCSGSTEFARAADDAGVLRNGMAGTCGSSTM